MKVDKLFKEITKRIFLAARTGINSTPEGDTEFMFGVDKSIDSWEREKYPTVKDYTNSDEYNKFIEFIRTVCYGSFEMFEMYNTDPVKLIGKKVITLTPGFTLDKPGQIAIVDSINGDHLKLIPCEESILSRHVRQHHLGWSIEIKYKHLYIKLK